MLGEQVPGDRKREGWQCPILKLSPRISLSAWRSLRALEASKTEHAAPWESVPSALKSRELLQLFCSPVINYPADCPGFVPNFLWLWSGGFSQLYLMFQQPCHSSLLCSRVFCSVGPYLQSYSICSILLKNPSRLIPPFQVSSAVVDLFL